VDPMFWKARRPVLEKDFMQDEIMVRAVRTMWL
jgi:indole-3-glycerol phosphate synthase